MCSIERFAAMVQRRPGARDAVLCPDEALLPVASQAARFAAKEALAKALGSPGGLSWTDAEVTRGEHGAPLLEVRGTVAACAARRGAREFLVSISHDGGIATAIVLAQGDGRS